MSQNDRGSTKLQPFNMENDILCIGYYNDFFGVMEIIATLNRRRLGQFQVPFDFPVRNRLVPKVHLMLSCSPKVFNEIVSEDLSRYT